MMHGVVYIGVQRDMGMIGMLGSCLATALVWN
jgi:hypothetical protein